MAKSSPQLIFTSDASRFRHRPIAKTKPKRNLGKGTNRGPDSQPTNNFRVTLIPATNLSIIRLVSIWSVKAERKRNWKLIERSTLNLLTREYFPAYVEIVRMGNYFHTDTMSWRTMSSHPMGSFDVSFRKRDVSSFPVRKLCYLVFKKCYEKI